MTRSLRRRRIFMLIMLFVDLIVIGLFLYFGVFKRIPEDMKLLVNREEQFDFDLPVEADFEEEYKDVILVNESNIPDGSLHLDFASPFTLKSSETGVYKLNLKLFGIIDYRTISVEVIDEIEVIAGGGAVGITMETEGVLVLGTGEITAMDGTKAEPAKGYLNSGDYIISANGIELNTKEEFVELIQENEDKKMKLTVRRNNKLIDVSVEPVQASDGNYKIGTWIRDDTQGIGTLTFITTTGEFGALGHGIVDVDTGTLIELGAGEAYTSEIINITKGVSGTPGELTGIIHQNEKSKIGNLICNTSQGIFGKATKSAKEICETLNIASYKTYDIALRQEIKEGKAHILCAVDGVIRAYSINIDSIDLSNANHSKGMTITITDKTLIEKTGGIVQGMSGSPIIQNGKLVGAVTHVFIRDSTRGYGTFIENMLANIE